MALYLGTQKIAGMGQNKEEDYSTDEKKIGTWINGKPLYRTVIVGTDYNAGAEISIKQISNLDEPVSISGFAIRSNGNSIPIPSPHFSDNTKNISIRTSSSGDIYLEVGSGFDNISKYYVIFNYTKNEG